MVLGGKRLVMDPGPEPDRSLVIAVVLSGEPRELEIVEREGRRLIGLDQEVERLGPGPPSEGRSTAIDPIVRRDAPPSLAVTARATLVGGTG